jgi:hypothetical protein
LVGGCCDPAHAVRWIGLVGVLVHDVTRVAGGVC